MKRWLELSTFLSDSQRSSAGDDEIFLRPLDGPLAYQDLRISAIPLITEFESLWQLIVSDAANQTHSIYLPVNPAVLQWSEYRAKGKTLEGYPYTVFNRTQLLKQSSTINHSLNRNRY